MHLNQMIALSMASGKCRDHLHPRSSRFRTEAPPLPCQQEARLSDACSIPPKSVVGHGNGGLIIGRRAEMSRSREPV